MFDNARNAIASYRLIRNLAIAPVDDKRSSRRAGTQAVFRPRLERLESRCVPTTNILLNTAGMHGTGYTPPDTIADVGPSQVVEMVNTAIFLKDKNGNTLVGQTQCSTFFSTIYGGRGFSDPYVVYDDIAQRFYVGILEFDSNGNADFDIAVSRTSTPTTLGSSDWYSFHKITSVTEGDNYFADYPKMGFNQDAVFVTFNQFGGAGFDHTLVLAIDKSSLLSGNPVLVTYQVDRPNDFTMMPARMHGATAGSPMYFAETWAANPVNQIAVIKETNYLSNSPTFAQTNLTVNAFIQGPSIPGLAGFDDRMVSADWRNNLLVCGHTIGRPTDALAHARWYEINTQPATPTLIQQGTIAPGAGIHTSFPGIGINAEGDIGLTYIQDTTTVPATMYITGRSFTDPLGTMQAPTLVKAGVLVMSQLRGGDYSFAGADPVDGTFWAANEYGSFDNSSSSNFNWGTQIAHFDLRGVITGRVFNDLNGNGNDNGGTDPGLNGRTVYIDSNNDGSFEAGEPTSVTAGGGVFSFGNLLAGTYHIREIVPAGWTETDPAGGSYTVTITMGQTASGYLFGTFKLITISGQVFNDLNGDGTTNGGTDPGLSGRTVYIDANNDGQLDNGEVSTTTNGTGNYSFANLGPGLYRIREVLPAGWILTTAPPDITTSSGTDVTANIGNFKTVTLSGIVFNDMNRDGLKQPSEPLLSGWTIFLDTNNNGKLDAGETSVITGATGAWSFANLGPGTFHVREVVQAGWAQSTPLIDIITSSGTDVSGLLIGNTKAVTIQGTVYKDVNGNGQRNAGDTGLQNWTVFIDANNDGLLDNGEVSTTTDASGNYLFTFLNAGTYIVREVVQAGWTRTTANPPPLNLNLGQFATVNFGNFQLFSISGNIWNDSNGDGTKQGGEPNLQGVTVYLDANNNGQFDANEVSTTTDVNGNYTLADLGPGTFRVREVVPAGWIQTTGDPAPIIGASGTNVSGVNFGQFQLITIGGVKFKDVNSNGVQDPGEPFLQGFTFYLDLNFNGRHDVTEPTATSDASGAFQFTDVGPGTYRVREIPQVGWLQTTNNPADIAARSGQDVTNLVFGNSRHEIFVASVDAGTTPRVSVFNPDNGAPRFTFYAFEMTYLGGVRVASADMNGDNIPDIICASGNGRVTEVRIFNGNNGAMLGSFQPFGTSFTGGAFVSSGDINGDGYSDIIIGEGTNGPPMVKVYDFHNRRYIGTGFLAYESTFLGGVHVVGEDLFGDGRTEIVTAPGAAPGVGRAPTVKEWLYNGTTATLIRSFNAYSSTYHGGVWITADTGMIVAGPGLNSNPVVNVFDPLTGGLIASFQAYTIGQAPNGVRVGITDRNGDGVPDIITAGGSGSQPLVRFFDGTTYTELSEFGFWAFEPEFLGGLFVAGNRRRA